MACLCPKIWIFPFVLILLCGLKPIWLQQPVFEALNKVNCNIHSVILLEKNGRRQNKQKMINKD